MNDALHLTWRQRASWMSHFAKAALRDHHRELVPLFRPLIKEDAIVADVGAHGGQMTRLFARLAPYGHVHSFEPAVYARSVLTPALALRGGRNISVWPYALSDEERDLTIATPIKASSAFGFGLAHVAQPDEKGAFRLETVHAKTFDQFVAEQSLQRLDFIKADIEGWELHFLRGAHGALARFKPHLYLEVSDELLRRAGAAPAALFEFLAALGYRGAILTSPPGFAPVAGFKSDGDYLFSPA